MIDRGKGIKFGRNIKVSIYGASHAERIGVIIEGIEKGRSVDEKRLEAFMSRRAPGNTPWATSRKEEDRPVFLSGIDKGMTTGDPIEAVIYNNNVRPSDYSGIKTVPRPAHADYPSWIKYGMIESGGGHFSGRMTAAMCVAGGLFLQWLQEEGIEIKSHIASIGEIEDEDMTSDSSIDEGFPIVSASLGEKMKEAIQAAKDEGDSLGGTIECEVRGMPAGAGEPLFGSLEGMISQCVFAVPAVKGIEFGRGFEAARIKGSENNDPFAFAEGKVITKTNNHGGILGGLSSGMPIRLKVAIKPTPSIAMEQTSVDLDKMEETKLKVGGRHDPCIVPRAVPCIEAAVALAIYDAMKDRR